MERENSGNSTSNKILSLWRDLFQSAGGEPKKKKNNFLLLILLLGIILLYVLPLLSAPQKAEVIINEPEAQPRHIESETDLARALERILEHIDGISDVQVFINYAATREGGTREIGEINKREEQVLLRNGGGGEEALLLKEIMPEIKGVMVVARGAENSYLRLEVVRAIQSVLDLPVHRISLLPYGN